jgi:two-component system sensor histidine kinase/response regulator
LQQENEIRHLNEIKARMFGLIARDIRQPLTSFTNLTRSFVGTMSTLSQEETIGFLKNLHTTIVDLRQSLNNISNWAIIESEEMPLRKESILCMTLAQDAVNELAPSIRQKELVIDYFIPDQQKVLADKIMVNLVLQNLLSNAIKFSHVKGQLTIFSGKKGNLVTLGIKDHGVGISEEEIKKIFDVNVSINDKLANRSRGVGLLICRELIEKNGGNMYVESVAGKGSTFCFSLPES